MTYEAAMGLAYGMKSEKNGSVSSRIRSLLLGMKEDQLLERFLVRSGGSE